VTKQGSYLYRMKQHLVSGFRILNMQGERGQIMGTEENLAREIEEIEQVVKALARSVGLVLKNQDQILQNQAAQSEILNKILAQVAPPGPGLASTQKIYLEPQK
jgi:hypothetical protein